MRPRVVVTGLGTVGSYGAGRAALLAALRAGRPRLSAVDRAAGRHRAGGARQALLVAEPDLAAIVPAGAARRMGLPSRLAVAAARLAVEDAAIATADAGFARTAVVLATTYGPAAYTEKLLQAIFGAGPETASPALFTESVASAPAAQVAIHLAARGPSLTVVEREAGGLIALAEAVRLLRRGRADRVLAGVVDELTPLLHAILDRFHALATADADGCEAARPFDRGRHGFLAAEGATLLVLERAADARARGAEPLCTVAGAWSAFDPTASASGWGTGADRLGSALRAGVARQGLGLGRVDRIVSGASGAIAGDRLEARTLRVAWNGVGALPPVLAPKGTLGEYGGGLLAAAVLAAAGEPMGPTAGFRAADPELGIVPHDGSRLAPPALTLVTTLAAGGAAAWALLERA